jgi:hypothetical protein
MLLLTVVLALAGICGGPARVQGGWPGVDEAVVEPYATAAGRPPRPALLDPGEGDLGAFLLLVAGAIGGFVGGYCFRELFPRPPKGEQSP